MGLLSGFYRLFTQAEEGQVDAEYIRGLGNQENIKLRRPISLATQILKMFKLENGERWGVRFAEEPAGEPQLHPWELQQLTNITNAALNKAGADLEAAGIQPNYQRAQTLADIRMYAGSDYQPSRDDPEFR
jgi:3-oxoacyl-(acyl-carrier-protein) synthase